MRDLSPFNFGLIVAYLVPGFVILWGLSFHFATVAAWLANPPDTAPAIGDLFYATLASVACGMIVNLARWAILDTIHHRTGVPLPPWDFSQLHERLAAYELLVEFHYRFYQFGSNVLLAILFAYVAYRSSSAAQTYRAGATDIGVLVTCVVLFLGSRDALKKYYARAGALLQPQRKGVSTMANGGDKVHHTAPKGAEAKAADAAATHGSAQQPKPASAAKPQAK